MTIALPTPVPAILQSPALKGLAKYITYAVCADNAGPEVPKAVLAFGEPAPDEVDLLQIWYTGDAQLKEARNMAVRYAFKKRRHFVMFLDGRVRPDPVMLVDLPLQVGFGKKRVVSVRTRGQARSPFDTVDLGCCVVPTELFLYGKDPWFTSSDAADSGFVALAHKAGYRLLFDDRWEARKVAA